MNANDFPLETLKRQQVERQRLAAKDLHRFPGQNGPDLLSPECFSSFTAARKRAVHERTAQKSRKIKKQG